MQLQPPDQNNELYKARIPHLVKEGWKDITKPQEFRSPQKLLRVFRILLAREEELLMTSGLSLRAQKAFFDCPLSLPQSEIQAIFNLHNLAQQLHRAGESI